MNKIYLFTFMLLCSGLSRSSNVLHCSNTLEKQLTLSQSYSNCCDHDQTDTNNTALSKNHVKENIYADLHQAEKVQSIIHDNATANELKRLDEYRMKIKHCIILKPSLEMGFLMRSLEKKISDRTIIENKILIIETKILNRSRAAALKK